RDQQSRTAAADGMAQWHRSAVNVGLLGRQAKFLAHDQSDGGERLVDLEQVDRRDVPAHLVDKLSDGTNRRGGEPLWLLAVQGGANDPRLRLEAQRLAFLV